MNDYDVHDLMFLMRSLRVEAHKIKKTNLNYATTLFEKLDRIEPKLPVLLTGRKLDSDSRS